jgi:chaperonin GroEL
MQKLISSGLKAMTKIKEGVDLLANPVKSTISPNGRTVIINRSEIRDYSTVYAPIEVTKDGYKIAMSVSSPDQEIQTGVLMVQEAAKKQMIDAGDGTSTVCLLTQSLLDEGLKLIESGVSHIEISKGINAAVYYVVDELKKMAIPIGGDIEKIRQVATVCSNNDKEIGNLIAQAFEKIGTDGVINIEEAKGRETTIKTYDGIKFGHGWASQFFVTNFQKLESVLEDPFILIYDKPITQLEDKQFGSGIMPLLQKVANHNTVTGKPKPLMIFCDDVDGEALATLAANTQKGTFQSCVVNMRWLGEKKIEFLEDIAIATGGKFISALKGDSKLESVELSELGQCKRIVVGKEETVIIEGYKNTSKFEPFVENLKLLEEAEQDIELKDLLRKRIARLKGSVAILSVGATTEVEMKEKKDRVDDACRATRSAIEEGVICGAGTAFLRVPLPIIKEDNNSGIMKGYNVVFNAIEKSLEQVCINSVVDFYKIKKAVIDSDNKNFGYNAKVGILEDLLKAGIIEPIKSNRCALQNAASVVTQILNSQFTITDIL